MTMPIVIGLVIAIPVILIPVAFVWFLNLSGMFEMLRATRARTRARKAAQRITVK